jgi:hypothetical protein
LKIFERSLNDMKSTASVTKMFVLALAAALLAVSLPMKGFSQSQVVWQQTNGPLGGWVTALIQNAAGQLVAATYGGGVFRSTDNGNTWMRINAGLLSPFIQSLAVNTSGQLFAGTNGGGVFRTLGPVAP